MDAGPGLAVVSRTVATDPHGRREATDCTLGPRRCQDRHQSLVDQEARDTIARHGAAPLREMDAVAIEILCEVQYGEKIEVGNPEPAGDLGELSLRIRHVLAVASEIIGPQLLAQPWLLVALTIYFANLAIAFFIQRPNLRRLVGIRAAADDATWKDRARRQRYVSYLMAALVGMIGFLMSTKPTL